MGAKGVKQITLGQRHQVTQVYTETQSIALTAERLGLSYQQVRKELRRQGATVVRQKTGACYRKGDEVKQLAAQNLSLSEIARRIGTNKRHVRAYLVEQEIARPRYSQAMENNPRWKGGKMVDPDGYILIKRPDHPHCNRHGYVREHRLVMEEKLGRYLEPTEVVHHLDDDPSNNHPDNLEIFSSNTEHLAATLKGKRPNWTPQGFARMQANGGPRVSQRQTSNPRQSKRGGER